MFDVVDDGRFSRRALLAAPVVLIGLVVGATRRSGGEGTLPPVRDVVLIDFEDGGGRIGEVRAQTVVRSAAEWRRMLSPQQYYVTRQEGTDLAFSGTYHKLHAPGLYRCIGCGTALFRSEEKFDSGTGWPSFQAPAAAENIATSIDRSLGLERTEVTCRRCGAHLGHVFDDGPPPTWRRYCINESSLRFCERRR